MQLRESQFERATEQFYEAAAVPELWPNALQAVAEACGAMGVCLYPIGPGPDTAICGPGIRGLIDAFLSDGWLKLNPYMQRGMALTAAGRKGLITSEEMVSPEEAARSPFVNEFADRVGLGRVRAGMVLGDFGSELALPIVFERAPAAAPYTRAEIGQMNRLVSGFKPAVSLALKVGFESSKRITDSLTGTGKDLALIGRSGRVLHMAPGLERHIGDAFDLRGGGLRSWERQTDLALSDAIRKAVAYTPVGERAVRTIGLPRRSGRKPLSVQIVPITGAAHDIFMLARAVMIVTDPEARPSDQTATMAATFGLSPAEARLAIRIGRGEELKDIAEVEAIAIETARARLKAVFAKTGTHRQVELAILVASLSR